MPESGTEGSDLVARIMEREMEEKGVKKDQVSTRDSPSCSPPFCLACAQTHFSFVVRPRIDAQHTSPLRSFVSQYPMVTTRAGDHAR